MGYVRLKCRFFVKHTFKWHYSISFYAFHSNMRVLKSPIHGNRIHLEFHCWVNLLLFFTNWLKSFMKKKIHIFWIFKFELFWLFKHITICCTKMANFPIISNSTTKNNNEWTIPTISKIKITFFVHVDKICVY